MNVQCLQENLAAGLSTVSRSVGTKSSLPILANVLIEAKGGTIKLAANNLETAITCLVGAKVETEGAITVPARLFTELVSALPPERVDLSLNETTQTLNIRCGHFEANLKGIEAGEFPVAIPVLSPAARAVDFDPAALKRAIGQVVIAAATEESRPVLTGVHVVISADEMLLEASDGFRLARKVVKLDRPVDEAVDCIIPARAAAELGKLLGAADSVQVMFDHARAVFALGDVSFASQLIEGRFPNVAQIIPANYTTRAVISVAGLLKGVKMASLFARDAANILKIALNPNAGIVLTAASAETGDNTADLVAAVTGEPMEIAFNSRYLADALAVMGGDVALETTEAARPGTLRQVNDDGFLYVIMPMHLGR